MGQKIYENEQMIKVLEYVKQAEQSFQKNDLSAVFEEVRKIESIAKTVHYYSIYTTYLFATESYEEGLKVGLEGVKKYPFVYTLHYNTSLHAYICGDIEKAIKHSYYALKYAQNDQDRHEAQQNIEGIQSGAKQHRLQQKEVEKYIVQYKGITNELDNRHFPINHLRESLIRVPQHLGTSREHMTNLYKNNFLQNINDDLRFYTKTETIKGKTTRHFKTTIEKRSTVPISLIDHNEKITIIHNGKETVVPANTYSNNQFYYLTFEEGELEIVSNKPIFIGRPIPLQSKAKKPLIIHIFIDALSQQFLEDNDFEQLMPRTSKFFEKGYHNLNCYAQSEWTLPSLASIVTGKRTLEHGLYHPDNPYDLAEHNELLVERLKSLDYYMAHFNNDWRSTPTYGYDQIFDRTIYQNGLGGFKVNEVVSEVIEHLETFKERNNYVWLTIEDLHDVADEIQDDLMSQVLVDAHYKLAKDKGITSVRSAYSKDKIERYKAEIARVDLHLSALYHYLEKNYDSKDYLVILNSDHGQSFLKKDKSQFMHEYRRKVPFMMTGYDVPSFKSDHYMENIDIYPTLLNMLNIKYDKDKVCGLVIEDFGGPKKPYVTTESYHPGQTYKATLESNDWMIDIETVDKVDDYGRVDITKYKAISYGNIDVEYILKEFWGSFRLELQR